MTYETMSLEALHAKRDELRANRRRLTDAGRADLARVAEEIDDREFEWTADYI